jgi:hypothetical protein
LLIIPVLLGLFSACSLDTPLALYATATHTPTDTYTATYFTSTPTATSTITPSPSASATPTLTASITSSDTPTPSETPTFTETVTPGPSPTNTRTPTKTRTATITRPPSRTPTITYTPTITFTPTPPTSSLLIQKPGPLSKIKSPIQMEAFVSPGEDGLVRLDLIGEDSRMINQLILNYKNGIGQRFWIGPAISFEITAAAETARLVLYTQDLKSRIIGLSSVDIILISVGDNEINPPINTEEEYLVRSPKPGDAIFGGNVHVVGLARPVNANPLILELIDEFGKVIGTTNIEVDEPSGNLSHSPFMVDIPYQVGSTTPARLTLRQESDGRIPGTVALSSLLINLNP